MPRKNGITKAKTKSKIKQSQESLMRLDGVVGRRSIKNVSPK